MIKKLILRSTAFALWSRLVRSLSYRRRMLNELYWMANLDRRFKARKELEDLDVRMGNWAMGPAGMCITLDAIKQVSEPKVLEMGLGESTKVIQRMPQIVAHKVIDHDRSWVEYWTAQQKNQHHPTPDIEIYPMLSSRKRSQYDFGGKAIGSKFNIFLIDGPFGAQNNSRRNILDIVDDWTEDKEFVVILDDVHRAGELQTYAALKAKLKEKNIDFRSRKISDLKEVGVICSMHNWQLLSI